MQRQRLIHLADNFSLSNSKQKASDVISADFYRGQEQFDIAVRLNNEGIIQCNASNFKDATLSFKRALYQLKAHVNDNTDHHYLHEREALLMPVSASLKHILRSSSHNNTESETESETETESSSRTETGSDFEIDFRTASGDRGGIGPENFRRTEYDEGMNMYRKPIAFDKSLMSEYKYFETANIALLYNLGLVLTSEQRYAEASDCMNKALYLLRIRLSSYNARRLNTMKLISEFRILHNIGYIQYRTGDHEAAIGTLTEALQYCRGFHHNQRHKQQYNTRIEVADTLNCLGVLYFHLPEAEADTLRSMDYFLRALSIRLELLGPDHPDCATTYNNIGRVHYVEGKYEEALKFYFEALRIRKQILGNNNIDFAATVHNMGQAYHQLGKLDHALYLYHDFLRIAIPKLGWGHHDVAIMLKCMAQIYHERNDFDQALPLYKESLKGARIALGIHHAEIASILNKMGNLYYEKDDFDGALEMYKQGLEVERKVLDNLHPNITVTLSNIGQIYKQRGDYKTSLKLYKEALDIQKKALGGKSHASIATMLSNIGIVHYQDCNYTEALDYYQEALQIRRDVFGECNLEVASSLNSIGLTLFKLGLNEMALQSFTESLRLRRALLGGAHRDVAIIIYNIATIYLDQGNEDEAMKCYKETLRCEREALGPDHQDVAVTMQYIAQLHQQRGELDEAVRCLHEVFCIQKKNFKIQGGNSGKNGIKIANTLKSIANIYLQSGNAQQVVELMSEAVRILRYSGGDVENFGLTGYHLYGFAKLHPESAAAA